MLCQFLSDILSEKTPYFGKHLFLQAALPVQDFATVKNFSFNQSHNKEFYSFCCES